MRLVLLFFAIVNCHGIIFSQSAPTQQLPIVRYVASKEGLNVRAQPARTGDRMGALLYGARVDLVIRSENRETIDGITDYWYALPAAPEWRHGNGWIFGGYLSETMPEDTSPVLGKWKIEGQDKLFHWDFRPDGKMNHGNPASGGGLFFGGNSFMGDWTLQGNLLTIKAEYFQTQWGKPSEYFHNETIEIIVTIINRDRIVLRFTDSSEHILVRDNDP